MKTVTLSKDGNMKNTYMPCAALLAALLAALMATPAAQAAERGWYLGAAYSSISPTMRRPTTCSPRPSALHRATPVASRIPSIRRDSN